MAGNTAEFGLRITGDTSDIENKLNHVANSFNQQMNNNPPVNPSNNLPPIINNDQDFFNGDQRDRIQQDQLHEATNRVKEGYDLTTESLKEFANVLNGLMDVGNKLAGTLNDVNNNSKNLNQTQSHGLIQSNHAAGNQLANQGSIKLLSNGSQFAQNIAYGNVSGAGLSAINGMGTIINSTAQMASGAGLGGLSSVLGMIGGVAIGTAVVGGAVKAVTDQYQKSLPSITKLYNASENQNRFSYSANMNSSKAVDLYKDMVKYTENTGLDADVFANYSAGLAKYGLEVGGKNFTFTQLMGKIAGTTNTDMSQLSNVMGGAIRSGASKNPYEDLFYLYGANRASGFKDNQFSEFLSGIQRVMEDGVAKGFVRSTKDVANTMVFFEKLSGNNPLWQGEKGAQKINQMNNSFAQTVGLNSSVDMIAYRAFAGAFDDKTIRENLQTRDEKGKMASNQYVEGGGYVNTMAMMERGLATGNGKAFFSVMNELNKAYDGDKESIIEALRKMTGFNYGGANELYNMYLNKDLTQEQVGAQIKKMTTDPTVLSDDKERKLTLNQIHADIVDLGHKTYKWENASLKTIDTNVSKIVGKMFENSYLEQGEEIANALGTDQESRKHYMKLAKEAAAAGVGSDKDELFQDWYLSVKNLNPQELQQYQNDIMLGKVSVPSLDYQSMEQQRKEIERITPKIRLPSENPSPKTNIPTNRSMSIPKTPMTLTLPDEEMEKAQNDLLKSMVEEVNKGVTNKKNKITDKDLAKYAINNSDFMTEINKDLEDKKIDDTEMARIRILLQDIINKVNSGIKLYTE